MLIIYKYILEINDIHYLRKFKTFKDDVCDDLRIENVYAKYNDNGFLNSYISHIAKSCLGSNWHFYLDTFVHNQWLQRSVEVVQAASPWRLERTNVVWRFLC